MSLSIFFFFLAGILIEALLLYDSAHPVSLYIESLPYYLQRVFSPVNILCSILAMFAVLLAFGVRLAGLDGATMDMGNSLVSFIFIILGVFGFFAAMAAGIFIPLVNEQSILIVQLSILTSFLMEGNNVPWLPLLPLIIIPALISLGLLFTHRQLPPALKALLYLWYLLTLMVLPFQTGQIAFFLQNDLTPAEAAINGALLLFLIIHGLFAARFFLMVCSLVRPRNHKFIQQLMPRLFTDDQVSLKVFMAVLATSVVIFLLNAGLGFVTSSMALNLCTLLFIQLLSRQNRTGK